MNYARLVLAAVAATIVDSVYGFIVYGTLLRTQFVAFSGVYRPDTEAVAYMPALFGGILVAALAASYIYAKGYEGGSGVAEGARFGAAIGLFAVGYATLVNFATINLTAPFTAVMAIAALVEWTINGIVIGLVYKPAASPSRRATGV
jgi:hypothetical protein